jgi:hypothetical protein
MSISFEASAKQGSPGEDGEIPAAKEKPTGTQSRPKGGRGRVRRETEHRRIEAEGSVELSGDLVQAIEAQEGGVQPAPREAVLNET